MITVNEILYKQHLKLSEWDTQQTHETTFKSSKNKQTVTYHYKGNQLVAEKVEINDPDQKLVYRIHRVSK